ncbi:MAG: ISKra4 family transposase [Desulfohalobiaceae bacterium]|nr:ISKra4 family transposase [Desulfohalobiaceae bacterium]
MSTARILDFQLSKQEYELERFQELTRKAADAFAQSFAELFFSGELMTLQDISNHIQDNKQAFLSQVLEKFIQIKYADYLEQEQADCPCCGKEVSRQDILSRNVDTLQGTSEISRPYFYCRTCKHGFAPLDEALGLSERRKQYDLQALAAEFLAEVPFKRASELFEKTTGVSFTDSRMHSLFASFAGQAELEEVIPSKAEIKNRIKQVKGQGKRRPVLVVASDGASVKIRPPGGRDAKRGAGQYREAKGFRIYLLNGDQILQVASWHQKVTAEELARDLKKTAKRIPRDKVRVCLIADGDHSLWKAMKKAFPGAREVLDYFHVKEYIHSVAEAYYSDDPNKALHWVEATMARLSLKGGVSHVIGGLKRMQPQNDDVEERIQTTITYLSNNKNRLNYKGARSGGYPIGSGGIESANKFICHTRLKRSGAWWLVPNCNNMLKLRCAVVNGTFDEVFAKYVTKERARRFAKNT